jgi:hypothetical protein
MLAYSAETQVCHRSYIIAASDRSKRIICIQDFILSGIGFSNKLILQFDKVFWPEDVGVFTMVTSSQSEAGMLQTWINLHRYVKKPLLMGMLHDQAAVRFENMTDNDIIENGRINRELRLTVNLCCFCSIVNI